MTYTKLTEYTSIC